MRRWGNVRCHPVTVRPNHGRGSRMTDANEDRAPATVRRDPLEVASINKPPLRGDIDCQQRRSDLLAVFGPTFGARIGSAYAIVIERPTDAFGTSLDGCGPRLC